MYISIAARHLYLQAHAAQRGGVLHRSTWYVQEHLRVPYCVRVYV